MSTVQSTESVRDLSLSVSPRAPEGILLAESAALSIIGDEDQSIYSFKHAHPEGITTFGDSHDGTHDETLDVCRRCPTTVVKLAKGGK